MANFRDLLNYFRPYWLLSIFSIAAASIYEIIDLFVPYAIGQILNVVSHQPVDTVLQGVINTISRLIGNSVNQSFELGLLLALVFIVTVLRSPTQPWLTSWFHWDIALKSGRDQTQKAIEKILTLPIEFYDQNNPGRIAGRVARGVTNHMFSYPEVAGHLIPKFFRLLAIFLFIWFVDWRIAIVYLISFITILGLTIRKIQELILLDNSINKYMEDTESRTSEIITNIKTVKAFATEAKELKKQKRRLNRELMVREYRIHKGYVKLNTWQRTVVQFCMFIVLGWTLAETIKGQISLGHFIMTLTISSMAYAELEPFTVLAEVFARRYPSMVEFQEFLKLPTGVDALKILEEQNTSNNLYQFTGKIEFSHIYFGYQPESPILHDVNLLIEPCQTLALVGYSGSGKSTLIKLLLRYFEPQQGQIFIDGQDICSLDLGSYRQRLAIVHQEVDVFNGTLLENLTYGNSYASFNQVKEACRISRLDEVVEDLPQGYSTVVGERGVRLSGGQRQRLGIARALLVEPDVLIFDEATSSLDYESERSIQLAMRSIFGSRTIIIIAHRLSTIREADKIAVLNKGRIVEIGKHDELLRYQGIYHRLYSLQG